ncbi:MAG TPA: tryptophan--tRNA ligase [Trueperaceae bacterium]|nr:tryptophan--tRNA ligase [Trueperaceae bacterium]
MKRPDPAAAAPSATVSPSSDSTTHRPRVFSGVQPTGDLHLGTYVGALRQWAERQADRDNVFCVVDLHALTIPEAVDRKRLHDHVRRVAALYMAAGIDPESNVIFVQSQVHEHAELTWLLNCVTPLGWLYRMTQFKTKSEGRESVGTGLLDYPVLQAADILLYDTDIVPVGDDQRQHIELTRDIAVRFNNLFGDVFVLPRAVVPAFGARIMGLDDPEVKMSKSIASERSGHAINLLDDDKTVRKAIMSAVTDSGRELRFEHASPGVKNLLTILQTLQGRPMETIEAELEGKGYGDLKKAVVAAVLDTLHPIRERFDAIMADPDGVDAMLRRGAERASETAARTLARVKEAMGVG